MAAGERPGTALSIRAHLSREVTGCSTLTMLRVSTAATAHCSTCRMLATGAPPELRCSLGAGQQLGSVASLCSIQTIPATSHRALVVSIADADRGSGGETEEM